jgi:hypothetical protein
MSLLRLAIVASLLLGPLGLGGRVASADARPAFGHSSELAAPLPALVQNARLTAVPAARGARSQEAGSPGIALAGCAAALPGVAGIHADAARSSPRVAEAATLRAYYPTGPPILI